jgi:hypothetical protein
MRAQKSELWSEKKRPLLGYFSINNWSFLSNGSVYAFPWQPNYATAATDMNATTVEQLEAIVSDGSLMRLCKKNQLGLCVSSAVNGY